MNFIEIASSIKERRKYLKMTQQEVADLADMSINTVVSLERGEGNPKLETVLTICDIIGLELIIK